MLTRVAEKNSFMKLRIRLALGCFLFVQPFISDAQVRLPKLVSDGMILQRGIPINIWGWAKSGESITVNFNNKIAKTIATNDGKWQLKLPAMLAGGPYQMEIKASNRIILKNILLGDVWVCSGQSNMELPMLRVKPKYETVIAQSENSNIRQFDVKRRFDFANKKEDFDYGEWIAANPDDVLNFTAVGYFFAKNLYQKYKVPIGLIKVAVGGSPAEAWISELGLKNFSTYQKLVNRFKDSTVVDSISQADNKKVSDWNRNINQNDLGIANKWFNSDFYSSDWKSMKIPGYWDEQGIFKNEKLSVNINPNNINGVFWFRNEIEISSTMVGKPALLILGTIVDSDKVYVNGVEIGSTSYQYPPRRYNVPAGLLKEGKNNIIIRVVSNSGLGGFTKGKDYALYIDAQSINLEGNWKAKLSYASKPMPGGFISFQNQPSGLFNGMINPLLNYGIKGVIWYQGESNTGKAQEYTQLFKDLIVDWRSNWNQKNLPFLYVQLPNFMSPKPQPSESNWAQLREAQLNTLSLPNTGMAIAIDAGEYNDIHPLDKQTIGNRLSLVSQKVVYGEKNIVYSGPLYNSYQLNENQVILNFNSIGTGLTAKNGELKGFAIAGVDGKFIWAKAKIENNSVVVWSDEIDKPTAIRYAWADNPNTANLYNKEGLPASPFKVEVKYKFNR